MVAMAVLARRRDQGREALQEFQRRQDQHRLPVGPGFGQGVDQALIGLDPGQPRADEDRPGAIADQSFQAGAIPSGDSDLGVEGETAAVVPPEHEFRRLLRQHRATLE
ncbi:MAG: hypothetical protein L0Z50_10585 [Verrucomicrobiales bacterium]|nr:hypothetical protein [Verrucomicrobiales bacterium]